MRVRFEKWEGLGNDFILLRDVGIAVDDALVRRLCDRRFGIGGDGLLLVHAGSDGAPPRMIVRNADGSRPEMCGNGLRCVAAHLATSGVVVVATDAGDRACEVQPGGEADGADVRVDMGVARRGADLVAVVGGREHRFSTVDMGNPHAVSFEAYDDAFLDVLGPAVAVAPAGGTNVEICRLLEEDDRPRASGPRAHIAVAVWERGVGRTLACGTGACAVAAVACDTGRARYDLPVTVALPGGALEVTVAAGTRAVRMRGPARRVFSGEVVIA